MRVSLHSKDSSSLSLLGTRFCLSGLCNYIVIITAISVKQRLVNNIQGISKNRSHFRDLRQQRFALELLLTLLSTSHAPSVDYLVLLPFALSSSSYVVPSRPVGASSSAYLLQSESERYLLVFAQVLLSFHKGQFQRQTTSSCERAFAAEWSFVVLLKVASSEAYYELYELAFSWRSFAEAETHLAVLLQPRP